ncbi:MAG: M1 family metallopeptidase [Chthonomonadales bacterium]
MQIKQLIAATICLAGIFAGRLVSAQVNIPRQPNPFAVPQGSIHYERDREYALKHVAVKIKLNLPTRSLDGTATETLVTLRPANQITFDAGDVLIIKSCTINGQSVKFSHVDRHLVLSAPTTYHADSHLIVAIKYSVKPAVTGEVALNGSYGFHWIEPDPYEPNVHLSFYTQGESEGNRNWVPIYDYPNNKATSETIVEAPANWFIVGNGKLISATFNKSTNTRTFHWKMTQPHATYLLSLAGGEMDVVRDTWEGVDLLYCVPKGMANTISASFGDTKDMLTFFSKTFGVKYVWPKYAQTASWDFGGGMENVSATTLGADSLVDARSGVRPMASLNSHELSHQWFGDLITCKDWGHIWLNEGFATFCEQIYIEHSRGKDYYDLERRHAFNSYLTESKRYVRPIATPIYPDQDAMFDSHTYPKGGLVLHMLRRKLGDDVFYRALGHYLRKCGYKPVDTNDLIRAISESSGIVLDQFFDQWVYKAGHPVIEYTYSPADDGKKITVNIQEKHNEAIGPKVYMLDLPYAVIRQGVITRGALHLAERTKSFDIATYGKPDAFLLDPDHDILMERSNFDFDNCDLRAIVKFAPCYLDKLDAALKLCGEDAPLSVVSETLTTVVKSGQPLLIKEFLDQAKGLKHEELRNQLRMLWGQPEEVQAAAIRVFAGLKSSPQDIKDLRNVVNDYNPYSSIAAAAHTIGTWDADGNVDLFEKMLSMKSFNSNIARSAIDGICLGKSDANKKLLMKAIATRMPRTVRQHGITRGMQAFKDDVPLQNMLIELLRDGDHVIREQAVAKLAGYKVKIAKEPIKAAIAAEKDATTKAAMQESFKRWGNQ